MTRCTDFTRSNGHNNGPDLGKENDRYAAYVGERNERGHSPDRGLNFHIERGAKVVQCVPGWRPDDIANCGYGVLVEYSINEFDDHLDDGQAKGGEKEVKINGEKGGGWENYEHVRAAVGTIVQDVLAKETPVDVHAPLMQLGLDSLHVTRLVRHLGE